MARQGDRGLLCIMKFFHGYWLGGLLVVALLALGARPAFSQVSLTIDTAPPELPVYDQPACPDDGYIWTPGYWAYGDYGYYWVPGTWVQPPEAGLLWTPSYYGYDGNNYVYYPGYWGTEVGFYGGINYGYGYGGDGYGGGRWQNGSFYYNSEANNIGRANVRNRYADAAAARTPGGASFNGSGGVQAQPSAAQQQFAAARHVSPTSAQTSHARAASMDRGQLASANGGRPATTAVATPKSYASVSRKHAAAQPLTKQDSVKEKQASAVKSSAEAAPNPQVNAEKPAATMSPASAQSRDTVTEPADKAPVMKPQAPVYDTQPRPEAAVQPRPEAEAQPRPQAEAPTQPRPQAEAQHQSRPAPEEKSAPRPAAGGGAAPHADGGEKPQAQPNR